MTMIEPRHCIYLTREQVTQNYGLFYTPEEANNQFKSRGNIVDGNTELESTVQQWCSDNIGYVPKVRVGHLHWRVVIIFENPDDVMIFKLAHL